jgi:hypothetical protein
MTSSGDSLEALEPLVGEWSLVAVFKDLPPMDAGARVTFEWLPGKTFLIERWEVPVPEAPDGIAIIGAGDEPETFRQYYFDSRGVHRIYEMTVGDGVWKLWRDAPDPFPQRFSGTFDDDGTTIAGRWEKAEDGSNWETDFDLTYRKVS